MLSYPNTYDQVLFGTVKEAWEMGAVAVGATIYFGSEQSRRQLVEIAEAFDYAHELGMATILWCYLRNNEFKKDGIDYHAAADLTGQANRLGVTIKADIVKQKLPTNNGGFKAIHFGKTDERMYTELTTDHPIDLCRYHGTCRADQLRWRVTWSVRPEGCCRYGSSKQTCRRYGIDQRT